MLEKGLLFVGIFLNLMFSRLSRIIIDIINSSTASRFKLSTGEK